VRRPTIYIYNDTRWKVQPRFSESARHRSTFRRPPPRYAFTQFGSLERTRRVGPRGGHQQSAVKGRAVEAIKALWAYFLPAKTHSSSQCRVSKVTVKVRPSFARDGVTKSPERDALSARDGESRWALLRLHFYAIAELTSSSATN
jgi:hypothetical protein